MSAKPRSKGKPYHHLSLTTPLVLLSSILKLTSEESHSQSYIVVFHYSLVMNLVELATNSPKHKMIDSDFTKKVLATLESEGTPYIRKRNIIDVLPN